MGPDVLVCYCGWSFARAKPLSRRRDAMSGKRLRVHELLSLLLILSLAPMQACSVAKSSPRVSSESLRQYDLSGVWTGTSITECSPLRMDGPWRCGARADLLLTLIEEDRTTTTGIFASDRGRGDDAFQETGRIVGVQVGGSTMLWLRVMMRNYASCLFSCNSQREEMEGSYICFRDGSSFERGKWAVRRSY
jgi:hypothetical protein